MNSRLGHHGGDHGHRCHGMERGRAGGFDRDSLLGEMGGGGMGGRRLHGQHDHCGGRNGERFGWGREGRVRLDDAPMHHRRPNPMGGLMGGTGSLNLRGGGLGGGGGLSSGMGGLNLGGWGLLGGMGGGGGMRRGLDGLGSRGSHLLGRSLDGALMDPRESPYLRQDLGIGGLGGMGIGLQDRLGGPRGLLTGGMGLGLGGGSRTPSLGGSNYSFDHLDRRPRPYHYQPPYVEDWESILEEEEMMEMLQRRDGLMQGADLYGPLPAGYDLEDMMGEIGGMGGLGGMDGRRGRL